MTAPSLMLLSKRAFTVDDDDHNIAVADTRKTWAMPTKHEITIIRRKNITEDSAEGEELLMVTMAAMPKIRYYCYGKPAVGYHCHIVNVRVGGEKKYHSTKVCSENE